MPLLLWLATLPATAADHFVCDCAAGAEDGCVPGDDTQDGTAPAAAWRSLAQARAAFSTTLEAGDRLLFCRGGAFSVDGGAWVNDRCTAADPCVLGPYDPPAGGGAAPLLHSTGPTVFDLSSPGEAVQQEGVTIEGLDLRCTGCEASMGVGVFLYNDVDHVTLRDLHISGFGIGVQLAGANPCASWDAGCDGQSSDLRIEDTTIEKSMVMGFLGAADRLQIHNSQLIDNGMESAFHHNLYVGDAGRVTTGIELRDNLLVHSAWQLRERCEGTSLVVHGRHDDLAIVGNTVREDPGGALEGCWGIGLDAAYDEPEAFHRAVLADNTVENVGNVSIGISACVDCIVENNVVFGGQDFATTGILAPDRAPGAGDATVARLTVRNNSIALQSGGTGIGLPGEVDGHVVVSNAITTASGACISVLAAPDAYTAFSHNTCESSGGPWAAGVGTLTEWQALGLGQGSVESDPGFVDPAAGDWTLAPDSPALGAGHPTLSAETDRHGTLRDPVPDAGAEQRVDEEAEDTGAPADTGPDPDLEAPLDSGDDDNSDADGSSDENNTQPDERRSGTKTDTGCSTAGAPLALGWLLCLGLWTRRRKP